MPAKRYSVEQIVARLREAEKHRAHGLTIPQPSAICSSVRSTLASAFAIVDGDPVTGWTLGGERWQPEANGERRRSVGLPSITVRVRGRVVRA